jgi:hypothetical protein
MGEEEMEEIVKGIIESNAKFITFGYKSILDMAEVLKTGYKQIIIENSSYCYDEEYWKTLKTKREKVNNNLEDLVKAIYKLCEECHPYFESITETGRELNGIPIFELFFGS